LQQVLSVAAIAGEQIAGSQQPGGAAADEFLEVRAQVHLASPEVVMTQETPRQPNRLPSS
jgi:hypothetical protein